MLADEDLQLSPQALLALTEFLNEKENFRENWQLSQFWYSEKTIEQISNIIQSIDDQMFGSKAKVTFISTPSVFMRHHKGLLLEFDERFNVATENKKFIKYDYNQPLNADIPQESDITVIDPPFLSEECMTKTLQTVNHLNSKVIIVCTGTVMKELLSSKGIIECNYKPQHQNRLSNEFSMFCSKPIKVLEEETGCKVMFQ
jgi:EEF1A lysine methyltransferase 1